MLVRDGVKRGRNMLTSYTCTYCSESRIDLRGRNGGSTVLREHGDDGAAIAPVHTPQTPGNPRHCLPESVEALRIKHFRYQLER